MNRLTYRAGAFLSRHPVSITIAGIILFLYAYAKVGVWIEGRRAAEEARVYNELCGTNITAKQARWLELRVDSSCKGAK